MQHFKASSLLGVLASYLAASCGGKVLFDGASNSSGGTGGASSAVGSTTSTPTGSGGAANVSGIAVTATSGVGIVTGSQSVSTGSGSTCDNSGICGDSSQGCVACALAGSCSSWYMECFVGDCIKYGECVGKCVSNPDPDCVAAC